MANVVSVSLFRYTCILSQSNHHSGMSAIKSDPQVVRRHCLAKKRIFGCEAYNTTTARERRPINGEFCDTRNRDIMALGVDLMGILGLHVLQISHLGRPPSRLMIGGFGGCSCMAS